MKLCIPQDSLKRGWESCLDIGAFTGVGYLCGHVVNEWIKWTSKPSLFSKVESVDLKSAAICCAVFMTLDRLGHALLIARVGKEVNKPVYSSIRIGSHLAIAVLSFNALASRIKLVKIETHLASAIILMAIIAYSRMIFHLYIFNERP